MSDQNAKAGLDSGSGHEAPQSLRPRKLTRLAWLPVPLLAMAIIAARAAGLRESYPSENLTLVLSFTFYTLVSLGTLFLIGRSFLASGTPGLLLLECGVVLWSLAGTVGDAVSHGDANVNVTIFNLGILVAGVCHLTGAILSLRPQRVFRARPGWLAAGCALVLGVLWLISQAALSNWLPVFFIPGQGGTPVRYFVLISAIAMFVLSAGLLFTGQRSARTPFTSWYALALLLLAVGLFGVMVQLSLGSVVNWLGRAAQWLGGVYLLLAAVAALRESDLPLLPSTNRSRPRRYRYGVAFSIVIAATAVRFVLLPALGTQNLFLTFYPAVILAALYGGVRAGLLSTVFSALVVDFFWMHPGASFTIRPTDWVNLLFFFLACTMISFIVEAMHKARDRLILHQDHLEELVKNRTAELEQEVVERKQAEAQISRSRKTFTELVERAPFGIYVVDSQFRIMQMNTGSQTGAFRNVRPVIGRDFEEAMRILWPEPVAAEIIAVFRRTLETGEPFYSPPFINPRHDVPIVESYEWELHRILLPDGQYGVICYYFDSTKLREAERALRESEEKLRLFIEHAPVAIAMFDKEMRYLSVSRRWLTDYGLESQDILGRSHYEVFPEIPDHWKAVHLRGLKGESVGADEEAFIRADGAVQWIHWVVRPWRTADNSIGGIVIFTEDITYRKEAQALLQRYELLASHSRDIILFINHQDGRILEVNAAAIKAYGYSREELLKLTIKELRAPDSNILTKEQMKTALEKGIQFETVHRRKDGALFPVEVSSQGALIDGVQTLISVVRNISERKHAEAALEKMRFMLSEGQRIAHVGSFEYVAETQTTLWSDEQCRIYGLTPGTPSPPYDVMLAKFIHPDDAALLHETFVAAMQSGSIYELEHRIVRPDGSVRIVYDQAHPYFDEKGTLVRYVGATLDITERKYAEEALRKAHADLQDHARKLEETNRELEGFSYTISHDLRAPLRAINGFARMLVDDYGHSLEEEARRRLGVIEGNAVKMGLLIDDLLAFSRAGRDAMNVTRIDMNKLVADVVAILNTSNEGVEGTIHVSPLPPAQGDPAIIRQVIINLLENAVKFSGKRPDPRIEVGSLEREGEQIYFVKDNGVGFDMKYYDKLFGVFQRLVTDKEFKGTGVGLAIVRRLVNRHGGSVWAEGTLNEGASFYFTLPGGIVRNKGAKR